MKSVNLNDNVYVTLSETGVNILREEHARLKAEFPSLPDFPEPSTDTPTRFQLWTLMHTFGPHVSVAQPLPFQSTTIDLEEL